MAEEKHAAPKDGAGSASPTESGDGGPDVGPGPTDKTEKRRGGAPQGKFAASVGKAYSRVAADLAELEKLRNETEHLRNQLRLAVADRKNIERLMQKEIAEIREFSASGFARDLISVCDNLEASLKNLSESDNVHAGVKMTWDTLISTLAKHGVSRSHPKGEAFDPRFHEAVTQAVDDTQPPGIVLEVIQPGYIISGRVLRPALVIVSKKSDRQE